MSKRTLQWLGRLMGVYVLCAAACNSSNVGSEARDAFAARASSENGIIVEWRGYTRDYQPGGQPWQKEKVELRFENDSEERWKAKYCIQLLDTQDVVANLGKREFVLDPGAAMETPHYLEFPRDLELDKGAYGLALVVHRPQGTFVNNVTIRIGETDEIYRPKASPENGALAACPQGGTNLSHDDD